MELVEMSRGYMAHIQGPGTMRHRVSVKDPGMMFSRERFKSSEEAIAAAEAEMQRLGVSRPAFEIIVQSWPEGKREIVLSEAPRIVEHRSYQQYGGYRDELGSYSIECVTCEGDGFSIRIDDNDGLVLVAGGGLTVKAQDAGWDERHLEIDIITPTLKKDYEF